MSATPALPAALPEPTDLDVAISVARQLLDSDQILSLREALRLLLRALDAEPATEQPAADTHTPLGPGCGAPATARIEGYSPRDGRMHGSLDLVVYACEQHTSHARDTWLGNLLPHTGRQVTDARCGQHFDFTSLDGGGQ